MAESPSKKYPLSANDYELYEEIGEGVSATVYRALCSPLNEIVAIKILDLEKCSNDLDDISREVKTMVLIDHPNLLSAHCSFSADHNLWVVMHYMAGGSCLTIMKSTHPEGFEEPVIATLLYEVLKALVYLHAHECIHRDVKAGNILLDFNGSVKLADFGVSACMHDIGDQQHSRNIYSNRLAPEVMQQLHGYDFKADIWSFGITALELAHGHAPFSKCPPTKLQNTSPRLDYERDERFSKSFKEMVTACLVEDPKKRPTAEKLLKHSFFNNARSSEYLERCILTGMSSLGDRFKILKEKEADIHLNNKELCEGKDHSSQKEHIRRISAWNFDLEVLKNQAAALVLDDLTSNPKILSVSANKSDGQENMDPTNSKVASHLEDELNDINDFEDSLSLFPMKPLEALKDCFDVCNDPAAVDCPSSSDLNSKPEQQSQQQSPASALDGEARKDNHADCCQSSSTSNSVIVAPRKFASGSLLQENVLSPRKLLGDGDRDYPQPRYQKGQNYSCPLQYRLKKDFNNSVKDAFEGVVVEHKGRFKVTSAELSPKGPGFGPVSITSPVPSRPAGPLLTTLKFILQQNTAQREEVLKLMKFVEQTSGTATELTEAGFSDLLQTNPTKRERELQVQVIQMEQSNRGLVEEIQRYKAKYSQLEQKYSSLLQQEDKIRK